VVGRRFGDRRASLPSPCLCRFDKARAEALPSARRSGREVLDTQTRRSKLRRDFPLRRGFWRQQPSDERADDFTISLSDEVQRGAVDGWSVGVELFGEALEHLKVVGSAVEVIARDVGMDARERLPVTPPRLSHRDRLHCLELKGPAIAGCPVDNDRVIEEDVATTRPEARSALVAPL